MRYPVLWKLASCCIVASMLVQVAVAQTPGNRFSNDFSAEDSSRPAVAVTPFDQGVAADGDTMAEGNSASTPGAAATVPADSAVVQESAGKAMAGDDAEKAGGAKSMLSVLQGAGLMAFPIAACSLLLVMFTLERAINLRRRRVIPKHFVKLFLSELEGGKLKPVEALQQCEENRSPISEVFAAAVKKWNRPSVEVEQAVIDAGEREANGLRRYLRLFNGIATVSPLLGLLGTVLGMIEAFNAIAASDAMGKPEMLAQGISQALLTTAGGLSVAIPAFIVYMYFTSRVDRLIIEIDSLGQKAVSAIASDAWKGAATKSRKAA